MKRPISSFNRLVSLVMTSRLSLQPCDLDKLYYVIRKVAALVMATTVLPHFDRKVTISHERVDLSHALITICL